VRNAKQNRGHRDVECGEERVQRRRWQRHQRREQHQHQWRLMKEGTRVRRLALRRQVHALAHSLDARHWRH
jgi:hypothetical protein